MLSAFLQCLMDFVSQNPIVDDFTGKFLARVKIDMLIHAKSLNSNLRIKKIFKNLLVRRRTLNNSSCFCIIFFFLLIFFSTFLRALPFAFRAIIIFA